jgi:hypothetical protein
MGVPYDPFERYLRFRKVGIQSLQPPQTGTRIRHDRSQRLADFVGNRRRHSAHSGLPRSMGKLAAQGVQLFLGAFEIGDVPGD